ncbi:hypothetical protein ACW5XA_09870 [Aeromonas dhakensis]|uniref:hypothetical protein n=1 Tax=Aeromonas dhakensis TaxID=196024 RepID=UPI000AEF1C72|nr:hypothetical protein [Aeromonas dhakensis]
MKKSIILLCAALLGGCYQQCVLPEQKVKEEIAPGQKRVICTVYFVPCNPNSQLVEGGK